MRVREQWPLLCGILVAVATLAFSAVGAGNDMRDLRGWNIALAVSVFALGGQLYLNGRSSLQRERRLVQTAAALREVTARLELQAATDTLTGLYNRGFFFERLGIEFRRAARYKRPVSVLMLDLDHFKQVNDRHGHPFGDLVLSVTAQTIRTNVRESDLVARYGGEEFVLLLPETGAPEAMIVAEKLRAAIAAQEFTNGIVSIHLTVSLGVATQPDVEAKDHEDLVRLADEALYAAKWAGRDQAVVAQPDSIRKTEA